MAVKKEILEVDAVVTRRRPIELITENGFSVVRCCEVDESITAAGTKHSFVVHDPHGYELEITVDISDSAVAEIISRSSGRLSLSGSYWICCAERHLADYLWDNDDYPPNARLTVDHLTPGDLDLARRWDSR